jgi:hypothetical protein
MSASVVSPLVVEQGRAGTPAQVHPFHELAPSDAGGVAGRRTGDLAAIFIEGV